MAVLIVSAGSGRLRPLHGDSLSVPSTTPAAVAAAAWPTRTRVPPLRIDHPASQRCHYSRTSWANLQFSHYRPLPSHPSRCPTRHRCHAAPPAMDYDAFQKVSNSIGMCKSLQDLRKLLEVTGLDPNVVATSTLHTANLFLNLQASGDMPQGRDEDNPEIRSYLELEQILIPKLVDYMAAFPIDTKVALVVACAQLSWYNNEVAAMFELVADVVMERFDEEVKPELVHMNLTMLAAAYATAGHYNSQFMDWLGDKVTHHLDGFPVPPLHTVLHVFWDLRHPHDRLLTAASQKMLPLLQQPGGGADLEPAELASLGLAFATFDSGSLELYAAVLGAMARSLASRELDPTTASLLQVLYLLVRHTGVQPPRKLVEAMEKVKKEKGEELVRYTGPALVDEQYLMALTSAGVPYEELKVSGALMGVEVERSLRLLGLDPERNIPAADGYILLHQQVSYQGQEVALQLCDRSCFCSKPYWRFKGTVLNELRALEKMGHQVVAVPWFEWDRLEDEAGKAQYLIERISRVASGGDAQGPSGDE